MGFFNEFPHTRTYDNDLGWIIKTVKRYDETITALNDWITVNTPKIEDLEAFKNAMESGNLPEGVKNAIRDWCRTNLIDLVAETIKTVFFGITDDGYFVAYIPESWSDIHFGTTGYDDFVPDMDYGHLTLSY